MRELRETFEAFLSGDDTAFAELYREVNPRLSAYCHKLAAGHAEDLMQELWERVIAMRTRTRTSAPRVVESPLAFLFRMVKNLAIDEHRKTKNEISLEENLAALIDWPDEFSQHSETSAIEAIILEALDKLPESDRELLVLNFYGGYTFGEIAEMLGLTNDAVWQRASRARARLRSIVEADARRLGIPLPLATLSSRKKEIV